MTPDAPYRASPQRSNVCAVVVTYFPKPGCATNLVAIGSQVDHLFIVDNGSSAQSLRPIESAAAELAEARRLSGDNRYASVAAYKAVQRFGSPAFDALAEETFFAGLRKAGVPEA